MKEKLKKLGLLGGLVVILGVAVFFLISHNNQKDVMMDLGEGLSITSIGAYSGPFYEDGTNEKVSGILAIEVKNDSNKMLQFCNITLSGQDGIAEFSLSTLKPNESVVVLEKTRKASTSKNDYANANAHSVVFFEEPKSVLSSVFNIHAIDYMMNITNISDKDVKGDIYVYYKNVVDDQLYGGITYRTKIEGGLKAGELKQVTAGHFSPETSQLMYIDIVGQ